MRTIIPLKEMDHAAMATIAAHGAMAELWLDDMPECSAFVTHWSPYVELLGVCKGTALGGSFSGTPQQKKETLEEFIKAGGHWVDMDVEHDKEALMLWDNPKQLLVSHHDFEAVGDLEQVLQAMKQHPAAVYKMAVTPQCKEDLEQVVAFAKSARELLLMTTMGAFGERGRELLEPFTWGRFMALSPHHTTASGQPTLLDKWPQDA